MALKYVKRGYHVLCSHGLTLALMPLAAMGVVSAASCCALRAMLRGLLERAADPPRCSTHLTCRWLH